MAGRKRLHIAWLGSAPIEGGSAGGAGTELLDGLAALGHRIDCFFPSQPREVPERLAKYDNLTINWGTSSWRWDRWYSRTKLGAFVTGLFARALASLRLQREVLHSHSHDPYDLFFQNQSIEALGVPSSLARTVPLVMCPQTEMAGELRCLLAEWRLSLRCQPAYILPLVASVMFFRALVQRVKIRRAKLLICISSVFRDHMARDYGFPLSDTVVIQNPINLDRFSDVDITAKETGEPPIVLVPTRIAVRKGIEDVVAVARTLRDRGVEARIRVVGGPSLFSDYRKLLDDLPPENAEYAGAVSHSEMPGEFRNSDMVLLPSKFDPCPLAVLEALACGVPVVGTSEVGSIENVDRSVAAEVEPGDIDGLASAVIGMLDRLRSEPVETRELARAEAERLFAPEVICGQISDALEGLVTGPGDEVALEGSAPAATAPR
ncbi:MAG TPA: glycosyltransferase family 4 protein [Solirubrobacteraceae bacterium]|jgi:glycosyltransferase involved in cell wall biosynthesis|nr:glycosyltransferase family 4 protein [Solirubrobacteraceae bacterium]